MGVIRDLYLSLGRPAANYWLRLYHSDVGYLLPDINPNFSGPLRKNGSWGKGITAAHLNAISYLNSAAFQLPNTFPLPANAANTAVATTKIGDTPRSAALNAWAPSSYNLNMAVQRSFSISRERVKFIFRADCFNVSNKVTFGGISQTWSSASSSTFGQITSASGNRDWQFSGRFTFWWLQGSVAFRTIWRSFGDSL
jgi:hypothetical protein